MTRINTNVPSLVARSNLSRANGELDLRLQRLSTGLRINRGADDPAGLIISERLRSTIRSVDQGIRNADRASSVIATAEGSLAEVSDLLNSIKSLIVEAANTGANSVQERDANQLQIDSAIDTITRISATASFGGLKLLNGSMDYVLSGVAASAVSRAQVYNANFISQNNLQVTVDVVGSAQVGALYMRGDYTNAAWNGRIQSATTLRVAGTRGVEVIEVTQSATLDSVIQAVNNLSQLTGVRAERINGGDINSGLKFVSVDFGSDSFVSVDRLGGPTDGGYFNTFQFSNNAAVPASPPFNWGDTNLVAAKRDAGKDVTALINGTLATGKGLSVSTNNPSLGLNLLLSQDRATRPNGSTTFYITGGGALFQLGPEVQAQQQSNIAIQSIAAANLGGVVVGNELQFLNSLKSGQANSIRSSAERRDFAAASDILDKAIDEVTILRGRLGSFEKNVLQTNVRSLQAAFENLSSSESRIRDADFASETSALTRAQILTNAGTSVLALANQQSQNVLRLLGG